MKEQTTRCCQERQQVKYSSGITSKQCGIQWGIAENQRQGEEEMILRMVMDVLLSILRALWRMMALLGMLRASGIALGLVILKKSIRHGSAASKWFYAKEWPVKSNVH